MPKDARHRKTGIECPLAGQTVQQSSMCEVTQKPYEACCGRGPPKPYLAKWMYHPPRSAPQRAPGAPQAPAAAT